jgi:hypothetical protein
MGGHGNFAYNLAVKLSVELDYFCKFEVINNVNSTLLPVLLVCNRRILRRSFTKPDKARLDIAK